MKNRGADMQPEFGVHTSDAPSVNYASPRTGGQVQDELRAGGDRPSARQTAGDPEDYSNAASDATTNTPMKPRSKPPLL